MSNLIKRVKRYYWTRRFKFYLSTGLGIYGKELDSCFEAEVENWINEDEMWLGYDPHEAVLENLSCWDKD